MSPQHLAFMVLINLIWALALVVGKVSLEHFPPFLFAAIRFALITVVLFPFLKIHRGRMKEVVIISLCAGALGFGLFFIGLSLSDASVVAIVTQLGVPISTILSVILLKEKIHWRRWLGIALAFLGVVVISFDPAVFSYLTGVAILVFAAMVGSVGTIYQRQLKNVGVFELQAWVALISWPPLLAASLLFEQDHLALVMSAGLVEWSGIFYVAFASSLIAHAGIYYLLQRYEVSQTAPLTLLTPVFTVFLAVLYLDEVLTVRMTVGALISLVGVLIVTVRQADKGQKPSSMEPRV